MPLLLALFVLLAGVYSVVTPAFETPDEIWHYAFIHHVANGQGLPVAEPNSQALWRQQGTQAPAYYLLAAALTAWIDTRDFPALYARANPHAAIGLPDAPANRNYLIHHPDEHWPWRGSILALHVARFLSVLLGAITLWAGYHTARLLVGPRAALAGTALMAFTPQFLFISAAASNDNAVNAAAAVTLWLVTALVVHPPATTVERRRRLAALGLALGVAALSKLSALGLLGVAGLALLYWAWRARAGRFLFEAALWCGLPALAVAGWWYARNQLLYGDLLAWNLWEANILLRVQRAGWETILGETGSLFRSYWGLFGWLNVAYPRWVYDGFVALTLVVVAGVAWQAGRGLRHLRRPDGRTVAALLLLLWLAVLTVSWLRFMIVAPAAQGRYFFPAAPTLIWLAALGLSAWRAWRVEVLAPPALALLAAITPFWIIAPAYRPPPTLAALPATLTPLQVESGAGMTLAGALLEEVTVLPGATLTLTVAWRADHAPDRDWSVFVHLVDTDGLMVAQADTMPGGGLAPTSTWRPGDLRVDHYRLRVPLTAYTPNQAHWRIGLYDPYAPGQPRAGLRATTLPPGMRLSSDALDFGAITIATPPGAAPNPVAVEFGDNITLAGYRFSARRFAPGDTFTMTLYWQVRGPVTQDYTTFVHLLDQEFAMFGGHDGRPQPPTPEWMPGVLIEDRHTFVVPPETPPGSYQVELGLYTRPDFSRLRVMTEAGAAGADRLLLGPLEVTPR